MLGGNAHKCPMFVEMEEDGGEWPVVQGSWGLSYHAKTLTHCHPPQKSDTRANSVQILGAPRLFFMVVFLTLQICTT